MIKLTGKNTGLDNWINEEHILTFFKIPGEEGTVIQFANTPERLNYRMAVEEDPTTILNKIRRA